MGVLLQELEMLRQLKEMFVYGHGGDGDRLGSTGLEPWCNPILNKS